jgi:hypothetical protein
MVVPYQPHNFEIHNPGDSRIFGNIILEMIEDDVIDIGMCACTKYNAKSGVRVRRPIYLNVYSNYTCLELLKSFYNFFWPFNGNCRALIDL